MMNKLTKNANNIGLIISVLIIFSIYVFYPSMRETTTVYVAMLLIAELFISKNHEIIQYGKKNFYGIFIGAGITGIIAYLLKDIINVNESTAQLTLIAGILFYYVVAFSEEMIFRTPILIRNKWVRLSAYVFFHLAIISLLQNENSIILPLVFTGIFGLLMQIIVDKTKNIWIAIGAHWAFDLAKTGLLFSMITVIP